MEEKFICKECKEELEIDKFYIRNNKYKSTLCKKCSNTEARNNWHKNKIKYTAVVKIYSQKKESKENAKLRQRKYAFKNKKELQSYMKNYQLKNKTNLRLYEAGYRKSLSDCYIRKLLIDHSLLSKENIPQSLIDLKRAHIILLREIKQMT